MKNLSFEYVAVLKKEIFIQGCNVPEFYSDVDNAYKDIQMVIDFLDLKTTLPFGTTKIKVKINYISDSDGIYHPKIGDVEVEQISSQEVMWKQELKKESRWQKVKRIFTRKKDDIVKR